MYSLLATPYWLFPIAGGGGRVRLPAKGLRRGYPQRGLGMGPSICPQAAWRARAPLRNNETTDSQNTPATRYWMSLDLNGRMHNRNICN